MECLPQLEFSRIIFEKPHIYNFLHLQSHSSRSRFTDLVAPLMHASRITCGVESTIASRPWPVILPCCVQTTPGRASPEAVIGLVHQKSLGRVKLDSARVGPSGPSPTEIRGFGSQKVVGRGHVYSYETFSCRSPTSLHLQDPHVNHGQTQTSGMAWFLQVWYRGRKLLASLCFFPGNSKELVAISHFPCHPSMSDCNVTKPRQANEWLEQITAMIVTPHRGVTSIGSNP